MHKTVVIYYVFHKDLYLYIFRSMTVNQRAISLSLPERVLMTEHPGSSRKY